MRVGARIHLFNAKMVARRKELGYSQIECAKQAGVPLEFFISVERLLLPSRSRIATIRDHLCQIANLLEVDFDELFPADYLQMVQDNLLPSRREPIVWEREVCLDTLPVTAEQLALPSPEEVFLNAKNGDSLKEALECVMGKLHPRERYVLQHRFGLTDDKCYTLEEIGKKLCLSRNRVRQIESKALRRLRNPIHSRRLRVFLDG